MLSLRGLHKLAGEKVYPMLNLTELDFVEDELNGHFLGYSILKNKSTPNEPNIYIVEKFKEDMFNDVMFNLITNDKGQFDFPELSYLLKSRSVENNAQKYIMYGEFNYEMQMFSKIAIIDVIEFYKTCKDGKIRIDRDYTRKTSHVSNGVLYGVENQSTDKQFFVVFDVGHLMEVNPNIIFFQYGFTTAEQRANKNCASDKTITKVQRMMYANGLKPSNQIHDITHKQASVLIALFEKDIMKDPEVRKILQNKALLSILNRYTK